MSTTVKKTGNPNKIPQKTDRAGLKGNRGKPKKGGGGGGYTWGKPGDELHEVPISKGDPNYDSDDDEENVVLVSTEELNELQALRAGIPVDYIHANDYDPYSQPSSDRVAPKLPLAEFKDAVVKITEEYFVSEDAEEFIQDIVELQSPMLHYDLIRRIVVMSMGRKERERELVSLILSQMRARGILTIEQVGKGFERMFEIVDDIILDVPHAKKYIAQFLARCVADEVLPPAFLSDPLVENMGGEIVEQAKVLLSIKHGLVRLERVWGPSDGSSVEVLKEEIRMMLEEFLSSSDMDEVCDCVKRLNVPHFHHEVVKRAIVIALDKKQRERAMMSSLLAELYSRGIVSQHQMHLGFQRLLEALPDLELDTPGATKILDIFISQAINDKCIDGDTLAAMKENVEAHKKSVQENGDVSEVKEAIETQ